MTTEAVTLTYMAHLGQTFKYKTDLDTLQETIQSGETKSQKSFMEMIMFQKVKDVSADGAIQLDIVIESGSLIINEQPQELSTVGQNINMIIKKNGEIASSSVKAPFTQHAFPSNSIKIGDTWTGETSLDFPGRSQPIKIQYIYKLEGFKNLLGFECAQIKVECKPTSVLVQLQVEQNFEAEGHTFFAFKEGFLVKSELTTKTKLTTNQFTMQAKTSAIVELMP